MPTFKRCENDVNLMAADILALFESHLPLIDAKVAVDYVFAYGDRDEDGNLVNDALKKNGVKALGLTRKIPLKDRALGRGDAEIALDGDWWESATEEERKALLDHELHHIAVKIDDRGAVTDDLGRPVLKLRPHDHEFGFFKIIAERHGQASQEVQIARRMMDEAGQYYWPSVTEGTVTISSEGVSTTMPASRFSRIARDIKERAPSK